MPLAEKRGVKLVYPAPPSGLDNFDFDHGKVELVLNNLISNALKFTPAGGSVRISVGVTQNHPDTRDFGSEKKPVYFQTQKILAVRVSDTGIGIAPENLPKIFDRFYQADASRTRAGEGTGIGLALSKELAVLMGGGITVKSELGKGSTFTFWLPVGFTNDDGQFTPDVPARAVETENPKQALPKSETRNLNREGSKSIALVIEDNTELRHFIGRSIEEKGWQVIEASDGEDGIKKAFDFVPDLVVSDVMMPRKDGFAVLEELKNGEMTAHIPVILLTAKSGAESKLKGLRQGADDYLTKPFSAEELLARMENLVENRRRLRAFFSGQLMAQTIGDQAMTSGEETAEFLTEPDRVFLRKFTLAIEENLSNEGIGIEDFAKIMLLSRSQLHRKMRALTDKSPTDFVRDYRLERAYAMLKNREGRVGEIALRVGFGNEKYFSTVFREKFGTSPSQI